MPPQGYSADPVPGYSEYPSGDYFAAPTGLQYFNSSVAPQGLGGHALASHPGLGSEPPYPFFVSGPQATTR